jgi:hypothetical protein
MGDKFFLGTCFNCRQRAEVHEGSDGLAYCEDCLVMLGKDQETAKRITNLPPQDFPKDKITVRQEVHIPKPNSDSKRNELIDWIVSNANSAWIDKFLQSTKENYAWVSLIEQEPNERILLRYATELGYSANVGKAARPDVFPSHIPKVESRIDDGSSKENRPDKRGRGRPKGSSNRNRTKKESKPLSLSNS